MKHVIQPSSTHKNQRWKLIIHPPALQESCCKPPKLFQGIFQLAMFDDTRGYITIDHQQNH